MWVKSSSVNGQKRPHFGRYLYIFALLNVQTLGEQNEVTWKDIIDWQTVLHDWRIYFEASNET